MWCLWPLLFLGFAGGCCGNNNRRRCRRDRDDFDRRDDDRFRRRDEFPPMNVYRGEYYHCGRHCDDPCKH